MNRTIQIAGAVALLAIALVFWSSAFVVRQTERALVLQFGDPRRVISEPGLYFKLPLVQDVVRIDKRILGFDATSEEVIAADQRRLVVDTFARFRIVDPLLFYQSSTNLQRLRQNLSSVMFSAVRGALGKQDSNAIISGERPLIMNQIRELANAEAKNFGIDIIDVRIKRADFPDQISQSIFQRMQTERQREARENRAQGAEQGERIRAGADRERTILLAEARKTAETLRGEGDAARTKILAEATSKDPDFYAFLRSLQAYGQAFQPGDTTMVLSPESEFLHYFANPPLARPNR